MTRTLLVAVLTASLWGLVWIPVRWLEAEGFHGLWAASVMNAGALAAIVVWLSLRRGWSMPGRAAVAGASTVGAAFTCYSAALNYSDVVRVVLLFYLAPIWGKIIESWAFGIPWTRAASLAMAMALTGAVTILGADLGTLGIRPGDGLALLSGVLWAAGASFVFTDRTAPIAPLGAVTCLSGVVVCLIFLPLEPVPEAGAASLAAGLAAGATYILPVILMTIWVARVLPPATLTYLLTAEIVVGVASSAWLLDEPFGWVQVAGTTLIVSGATIEVTGAMRRRPGL